MRCLPGGQADDINTMSFTTLLSIADSRVVKDIVLMSSQAGCSFGLEHCGEPASALIWPGVGESAVRQSWAAALWCWSSGVSTGSGGVGAVLIRAACCRNIGAARSQRSQQLPSQLTVAGLHCRARITESVQCRPSRPDPRSQGLPRPAPVAPGPGGSRR